MSRRAAAALLALALCACAPEPAAETETEEEPRPETLEPAVVTAEDAEADVAAVLTASPRVVHLGDRILVSLEVRAPADAVVAPPPEKLPPLNVIERDGGRTPDGLRRWTWEAAAFRLGEKTLDGLDVRWAPPGGDERVLALEPLTIDVVSVRGGESEEARSQPSDIRGPVLPPRDPWRWLPYAAAAAAAALLALLLIWVRRRLRRRTGEMAAPAPPEPPHVVALRRLEALRRAGPPSGEAVKPYYVELSEAVRDYLEGRYDIDAPERTTGELAFLLRRARMGQRRRDWLVGWLGHADLVKFARHRPETARMREDLEEAWRFVEETRLPPAAAEPEREGAEGRVA